MTGDAGTGFNHMIRLVAFVLAAGYAAYGAAAFLLWIWIRKRKFDPIEAGGEDILIIAPHQDDCVAIAGGYALQTREKGGRVRILYVTNGVENGNPGRRSEAVRAWGLAGVPEKDLQFLKYPSLTGLLTRGEIEECIGQISEAVRKFKPGTVFTPLYEGGHYQHDVVNYMTAEALKRAEFRGNAYESPEYNFYLSFRTTPEKILSGLLRFVPFAGTDYPPEPVLADPVYRLRMTEGQMRMKKRMIAAFESQHPDQLVKRFGFEDRYQKMHEHDYAKPPFDYGRSTARFLDGLKRLPAAGRFFSKMFKWTRTIHPAPGYTITRIPMREEASPLPGDA
jgi:LmbE family N-acetylglucosaminyl deacetylase